jgi:hypothetical protein
MPDPSPLTVICNTSPLYYLHRIGRLDILWRLYGQITVTDAVVAELEAGRACGVEVPDLATMSWVRRANPTLFADPTMWPDLGPGECSVLLLGLESAEPVLLILDDLPARRLAAWKRLRVTGTAGVLLRAKRQGILPAVRPCLNNLVEIGFHLKQELIARILELANET